MKTDPQQKPLVVITGISGLIGSRTTEQLTSDYRIVGLDVAEPDERTERVIAGFIECDLTSDDDVQRALDRLRAMHGSQIASVIHLAAYYDFSGEPSSLYRDLTVDGTRRLLRGLRAFEIEQFAFASTLLVMEPAEDDDVITEVSPKEDDPWDYPRSKIEAESVIRAEHDDIPVVILRMAGAYDEDGSSIPIAQHIARIHDRKLESYLFPGDAAHGQPFVHLDDVAACFRQVVDQRFRLDDLEVFLVAEPDVVSHQELQDLIGEAVHGREWPTIRIPKAAAKAGAWAREQIAGEEEQFIKPWMVDLADAHYPVVVDRARSKLGWNPRRRLRDAIPEMVRRMKRNPSAWYERYDIEPPEDIA